MYKLQNYILVFFLSVMTNTYSMGYVYDDIRTPACLALTRIAQNSFLGFNVGIQYSPLKHTIKGHTAECFLVENNIYLEIHSKNNNIGRSDLMQIYIFQWPNDSYLRLDTDPAGEIVQTIKKEKERRKNKSKTEKKPDSLIITKMLSFPIGFSCIYEFDSQKFRISIDPTLLIVRHSKYIVKVIANPEDDNSSLEKIGEIPPIHKWNKFLEIPFSLHYRLIHTQYLDLFLTTSAGFQFTNINFKGRQPYIYKFFKLGCIIELSNRQNIKPYFNFYLSKGGFKDMRIHSSKPSGTASTYFSIGFSSGINFRLMPKKSRCRIPNCYIRQNHVHGQIESRGKSYFND